MRGKSRRSIYCFPGASPLFQKASALPPYFESGSIGNNLGQGGEMVLFKMYMEHTKKNREHDFEMQKVCHIHVDVSVFIKRNQSGGIKG